MNESTFDHTMIAAGCYSKALYRNYGEPTKEVALVVEGSHSSLKSSQDSWTFQLEPQAEVRLYCHEYSDGVTLVHRIPAGQYCYYCSNIASKTCEIQTLQRGQAPKLKLNMPTWPLAKLVSAYQAAFKRRAPPSEEAKIDALLSLQR